MVAPLPPLVPNGMGKGSRGAPVPRSILYTLRSHCSAACGCVYTACAHVYDHADSCGLPPRELQLVYTGAHAGTHTQLTGHCVAMAITSTAFTLGLLGFPPISCLFFPPFNHPRKSGPGPGHGSGPDPFKGY